MWNYHYVVPSVLVLIVFVIYYFIMPRLDIKMNHTFLWILAVECMVMLADIVSSRADEQYAAVPVWLLYVLNMLFFVLFELRAVLFFRFTADILRLDREKEAWKIRAYEMVFYVSELITVSSFFTGAVFRITEDGYQRGPLYDILYVCFFFYIGISVVLLCIYHSRLTRFGLLSALAFHIVLFIGNIIRILMPQFLVMNTFCLMAIIIIYLSFEDPILYLESRGRVFNQAAFREILEETAGRRPYRILAFILKNYTDAREIYGGTQMDQGVILIGQYLRETYPAQSIFYLRGGRFVILGNVTMNWDQMREQIQERFLKSWKADDAELDLEAAFVQVGSASQMNTVDKIINNLYIALENAGEASDQEDKLIDLDGLLEIDRQVTVKRSLEKALEQGKVEIFLQPLVDTRTGKVTCAEALARIRDAEGKLILPGEFISVAEKCGKIGQVGEQVFEKTCKFISDFAPEEWGIEWINVNLSPLQCMRKDLGERFTRILREYHVNPERIHLEITEESMIDVSKPLKQIQTLQEDGFRFVLDDYGSGYSNLARVKRYPFTNIKLDMELVWDYFKERDVLLPTIIQAFKQMHFSVTAEGIETKEMADVMTSLGCDYLQGFYFSRPLPVADFVKRYQEENG